MNQSNDRIFLAADGGFYFYADDTRTGSYGPYATPDLAAQKLNEYLAWLHQQAAAETVAPQEKVQSLKDALLVLKTAIVLVERFL